MKKMEFEECTELVAPLVTEMVQSMPLLTDLVIAACGSFGTYQNAEQAGRDLERIEIMKQLRPMAHAPLRTFRIVNRIELSCPLR